MVIVLVAVFFERCCPEPISDLPGRAERPKAVGLVRADVSGLDVARLASEIPCYAAHLGYRWIYTVRPPERIPDPVGYALGIADGLRAAALVVPDEAHVDHNPARICTAFDLATLRPPTLRPRGGPPKNVAPRTSPMHDCTWEPEQLSWDAARLLWTIHRECLPGCRAQLAASAALSATED
ncbi:hypothetical protein CRH09_07985 [Nocardia terpenica]|uniref:Uncharacterized protein n=1 Tax=Nocardia terpenica TaxID=455432 RepID=A0A291RFT8_9NOCA|nr:hypothetical protein CRH09_07985 [Nocardia terpenica]